MSSYFINQLNGVLKNHFNHSKKEEKTTGDFYTQMKFKFASTKPNKYVKYIEPITYLRRFKSFIYYEWSKRKQENKNFKLYISCVVVSDVYIHRYDDIFCFDENTNDIFLKIEELDDILSLFFFPNVEVYFCLENEENRKGDKLHIIEDLLQKKEEIFIKKYGVVNVITVLEQIVKEKICFNI